MPVELRDRFCPSSTANNFGPPDLGPTVTVLGSLSHRTGTRHATGDGCIVARIKLIALVDSAPYRSGWLVSFGQLYLPGHGFGLA
jgi:hypothetical protein